VGGRVGIKVEEIGDRYRIEVRDFGAGIPAENLPRIFEPFFTSGRARGGTGLGMAIVHNLVTNALKGEIALDSMPGNGTTVTVTIPKTLDMR
jgi:signal transduction histidine kinase